MNNYFGFTEFLLDRSIEKIKETKEFKFIIIRIIVELFIAVDVFG